MEGTSALNQHLLEELSKVSLLPQNLNYIRLQTTLTKKRHKLEAADEDNLKYLLAAADRTIEENSSVLDKIANSLADKYENQGYILFPDIKATKAFHHRLNILKEDLEKNEISAGNAWRNIVSHCNSIASLKPESLDSYYRDNLSDTIFETESKVEVNTQKNKIKFLPRELEVLKLLSEGYRSKEIAPQLNMSPSTVESYINLSKQKTGCIFHEQLIRFYRENYPTDKIYKKRNNNQIKKGKVDLSPTELQILKLYSDGYYHNNEIAVQIGMSPPGIEAHVKRLMQKIECHAIGELIRFYRENYEE